MSVTDFDFRNPPARKQSGRTTAWLGEYAKLVNQHWAKKLPYAMGVNLQKLETVAYAEIRGRLPANGVAFRVRVTGDEFAILVLPRPFLACLIGGTFGEVIKNLPEDRGLTPVEESITPVVIEEFFLSSLRQVVSGECTLEQRGTIRAVSKEPDSDLVLAATFGITEPFDSVHVTLLWPEKSASGAASVEESGFPVAIRSQMEQLVKEMPAEFSVVLGDAQISLSDLAEMRIGDLVVLNQKIHQPLPAKIMGAEKFSVWPGAVGSRQAVQIETVRDRS